ncbi:MAG: hypothetical protein WKG07_01010 [Hymenobacter sp.]
MRGPLGADGLPVCAGRTSLAPCAAEASRRWRTNNQRTARGGQGGGIAGRQSDLDLLRRPRGEKVGLGVVLVSRSARQLARSPRKFGMSPLSLFCSSTLGGLRPTLAQPLLAATMLSDSACEARHTRPRPRRRAGHRVRREQFVEQPTARRPHDGAASLTHPGRQHALATFRRDY